MKNLIFLLAGAALGSLVTFAIVKKKYEQIAQEEIDSVKETFSKRNKKAEEKPVDDVKDEVKTKNNNKEQYIKIANKYNTSSDDENEDLDEVEDEDKRIDRPYVISPDDFGEFDDYECISLVAYMGDGVLTDDDDEIIDNVDEVVGLDYADHFGEYEDNYVYIRNDKFKCDYEISMDHRKFSETNNITMHGGYRPSEN